MSSSARGAPEDERPRKRPRHLAGDAARRFGDFAVVTIRVTGKGPLGAGVLAFRIGNKRETALHRASVPHVGGVAAGDAMGCRVTRVDPGGLAAAVGLRVDDVVVAAVHDGPRPPRVELEVYETVLQRMLSAPRPFDLMVIRKWEPGAEQDHRKPPREPVAVGATPVHREQPRLPAATDTALGGGTGGPEPGRQGAASRADTEAPPSAGTQEAPERLGAAVGAASESASSSSSSSGGPRTQHQQPHSTTKVRGTCNWFSDEKGFGFITCEDTMEEIFVHQTDIKGPGGGCRTLSEGDAVEFEIGWLKRGHRNAVNVTVMAPGGAPMEPPVSDPGCPGGVLQLESFSTVLQTATHQSDLTEVRKSTGVEQHCQEQPLPPPPVDVAPEGESSGGEPRQQEREGAALRADSEAPPPAATEARIDAAQAESATAFEASSATGTTRKLAEDVALSHQNQSQSAELRNSQRQLENAFMGWLDRRIYEAEEREFMEMLGKSISNAEESERQLTSLLANFGNEALMDAPMDESERIAWKAEEEGLLEGLSREIGLAHEAEQLAPDGKVAGEMRESRERCEPANRERPAFHRIRMRVPAFNLSFGQDRPLWLSKDLDNILDSHRHLQGSIFIRDIEGDTTSLCMEAVGQKDLIEPLFASITSFLSNQISDIKKTSPGTQLRKIIVGPIDPSKPLGGEFTKSEKGLRLDIDERQQLADLVGPDTVKHGAYVHLVDGHHWSSIDSLSVKDILNRAEAEKRFISMELYVPLVPIDVDGSREGPSTQDATLELLSTDEQATACAHAQDSRSIPLNGGGSLLTDMTAITQDAEGPAVSDDVMDDSGLKDSENERRGVSESTRVSRQTVHAAKIPRKQQESTSGESLIKRNGISVDKDEASLQSHQIEYSVVFQCSQPLGFFCVTTKGEGGAEIHCQIKSVFPQGQARAAGPKIQNGTVIVGATIQNADRTPIKDCSQLREIYKYCQAKKSTLQLFFLNQYVSESSIAEGKRLVPTLWSNRGNWKGVETGWPGGAQILTESSSQNLGDRLSFQEAASTSTTTSRNDSAWVLRESEKDQPTDMRVRSILTKGGINYDNEKPPAEKPHRGKPRKSVSFAPMEADIRHFDREQPSRMVRRPEGSDLRSVIAVAPDLNDAILHKTFQNMVELLKKGAAAKITTPEVFYSLQHVGIGVSLKETLSQLALNGSDEALLGKKRDLLLKRKVLNICHDVAHSVRLARSLSVWYRFELQVVSIKGMPAKWDDDLVVEPFAVVQETEKEEPEKRLPKLPPKPMASAVDYPELAYKKPYSMNANPIVKPYKWEFRLYREVSQHRSKKKELKPLGVAILTTSLLQQRTKGHTDWRDFDCSIVPPEEKVGKESEKGIGNNRGSSKYSIDKDAAMKVRIRSVAVPPAYYYQRRQEAVRALQNAMDEIRSFNDNELSDIERRAHSLTVNMKIGGASLLEGGRLIGDLDLLQRLESMTSE